ncbi:MAG TPA: ABC transporter permease [Blastocatellia bacterium]|nr:ABC transporter permease [Blastocatellia bacterium]
MSNLIQDLRFGLRLMMRRPGITSAAILSLALGIGANTAVFSAVNTVMLRPLRFADPGRIVRIWGTNPQAEVSDAGLSPMNFLDYKAQSITLEHIAGFTPVGSAFNLEGGDETERIQGARVTANFFDLLGVTPALGRAFIEGEDQSGRERVVVLSNAFWQRRFGGDRSLVDQPITLNGASYTVIGVMPPDFDFMFMRDVDLFAPIAFGTRLTSVRHNPYLMTIARLKQGASVETAQAELATIANRLEQQYPEANKGWGVEVQSLSEYTIKPVRPLLLTLMGAVAFVLLIACANVANLLLVRAIGRQKEIGVRTALGASRSRLIQQMLSESVILSLVGGGAGIFLAFLGLKLLMILNPRDLPRLREIDLDGRVLGFTLAVSVLTGILFGLAPAIRASRVHVVDSLKDGEGRSTGGVMARRVQSALVICGIAVASALLIGAGLLIKSFMQLQATDPGFVTNNLLTMQVSTSPLLFPESQDVVQFWNETLKQLEAMPGVKAVAAASDVPNAALANRTIFSVMGQAQEANEDDIPFHAVSRGFFETMGIELIAGRAFTEQETDQSARAVIVNEALAKKYFPDGNILGQRLSLDMGEPWVGEVVGIVNNVRHEGATSKPEPEVYVPFLDFAQSLVVRTTNEPMTMAAAVRKEITRTGKRPPVYKINSMDNLLYESVAKPRMNMVLLAIFAGVAFILAALGLYSLISYSVSQRTREIGVRMALGAEPRDVLRLILRQGMKLILTGAALGLVLAYSLTRLIAGWLSPWLYGLSPTDPLTFGGVTALLIGVALLAIYFPSRRATKVEPVVALRYE